MRISTILASLLLLPVVNSFFVNIYMLSKNFKENMFLKTERAKTSANNTSLSHELKQYTSPHGLKRSIKEELKHIENNEILLRVY